MDQWESAWETGWLSMERKALFHRALKLAAGCLELPDAGLPSRGICQWPSCHIWKGLVTGVSTKFPFFAKVIWVQVLPHLLSKGIPTNTVPEHSQSSEMQQIIMFPWYKG